MVSIFCSSVALVELVAGADATSLVLSSLPGISDTKLLELRLLEYYGPYVCWPIRVLYFVPVSVARVSFLCISTWYQSLDCSQPSPPPLPSPSRHRPHGWPAPSPLLRRALPSSPSLLHGCVGRAPSSHARRDSGDGPHGRASRAAPSLRRIRRARSVAPPPVGLALMAGSLSPPPPSGGSGPARTRPRWHPSHAHPHPHEAVSHLCGGQKRYASRGASPLRRCNHRSRHGPLQHTLGCPLRLRGGSYSPHSGPAALWSSVTDCWLRGGGGCSRSQGRTQWRWPVGRSWWLLVAILLQPVDWHHSHVARAVHGCLGPSPHRLSPGLLCRCTPGGTLGSSLASARSSATPKAPTQPMWGPWTNEWDARPSPAPSPR
jgi:hypothetical protein